MRIRYALFDVDGTLINSLFFWQDKWKEVCDRYLHIKDYTPPRILNALPVKDCAAYIKKEYHLSADEKELFDFILDDMVGFYKRKTNIKSGAVELLAYLEAKGVEMCVTTANEQEITTAVLAHFGLLDYFKAVVSCADKDVGEGKYSPRVFEKALGLLGAKPEETVIFEDSHVSLCTAKKMGMRTVGIEDLNNHNSEELAAQAEIFIRNGENIFETLGDRFKEKDFEF